MNGYYKSYVKKSDNVQIFTLTHKVPTYGLETTEFRTPLHVGKANHPDTFVCPTCDNTGDNISEKNGWFLETTGLYWVWKNIGTDIKGCEQYRRRFPVTEDQVKSLLETNDVIVFAPRVFADNISIRDHYQYSHNVADIDLCGEIVKEMYPDMWPDFDKYINKGHTLYMNNSFIAKKEDFDKICSILFSILFEHEKRKGFKTTEEWQKYGESIETNADTVKWLQGAHPELTPGQYQMRIYGSLSERLITFIVQSLYTKIYAVNPKKFEQNT